MTSRKVKGFLHGALRGIISSKISWSISHKTAFHSIMCILSITQHLDKQQWA